jgi:choline dehydrogenase
MQYMLSRTGPLTLAASQVAIFTRSGPDVTRPDIQFHMQPLSADKPGEGPHRFSAFTSSVCQLRPHSRGRIAIRSADAREYPAIHPGYLSDERDHPVVIGGIKVARRIAQAPALAPHILSEFVPGEIPDRCRTARRRKALQPDDLSPGGHLQDGHRPDGGGR